MGELEGITWESLATVGGVAAALLFGVLPLAKAFGARGNALRIIALVAGQLFPVTATLLLEGCSLAAVLNGVLTGFLGSCSALGAYQLIEPFKRNGAAYP